MKQHTCTLRVCLDDLLAKRGAYFLFDMIEQVKYAILSKGARVRDLSFSTKPDREFNPCGDIGTITFDVITPYECEGLDIELICRMDQTDLSDRQVFYLPEVKVRFK